MGASQSLSVKATECKYKKQEFKSLIGIIQNAHDVLQFYASSALIPISPIKLPQYPLYESEDYYNVRRKLIMPELEKLNIPSLSTVYDSYNYMKDFQKLYEQASDNDVRKKHLDNVFNVADTTLRILINELQQSCLSQGLPPPK